MEAGSAEKRAAVILPPGISEIMKYLEGRDVTAVNYY